MSVHAEQPSTDRVVSGVEQSPLVTSQMLARPRDSVAAAQDENERQQLMVFNPSPERDSLLEHLVPVLARAPREVADEIVTLFNDWSASNLRERHHQHQATGSLESMSTMLYAAGVRSSLTIRRAGRILREPLKVIRDDMCKPAGEPRDGVAYIHAAWKVKDVIGEMTSDALRSSSMRVQLGTGLHEVLLSLLTDGAPTSEAIS